MAWFKLDDGWLTNPKIRRIGKDGRALWIAGGLHCAQHLTDGRIDKDFVPLLAALADVKPGIASALVGNDLWLDHGDHYEMHQFLDYQPSRDKVLAERDANRERQARYRRSNAVGNASSAAVGNGGSNAVTNGVSNGTPTRPDPTRPVQGVPISTTDDDRDTRNGSSSSAFDQVISTLVEAARLVSKEPIGKAHAWEAGVRRNITTEQGDTIRARLAEGVTPQGIATEIVGDRTTVRVAMRSLGFPVLEAAS